MKTFSIAGIAALGFGLIFGGFWILAQDPPAVKPTFKAKVDLVVLSFTVTDSKGHYVNNLKPSDFKITEDTIPEKLSTFAEGDKPFRACQ